MVLMVWVDTPQLRLLMVLEYLTLITRKMFATGLKKAISTGANSVIAHKISDAVVNGATSASQKAVESVVNEAVNTVKPIVKESLKKLFGHTEMTITFCINTYSIGRNSNKCKESKGKQNIDTKV